MRGAVLGDVISSLLSHSGYEVIREYYVNNSGSQIDVLGRSLYKRYLELYGQKIQLNNDEYPGNYLIEIAQIIKNNNGGSRRITSSYFKNFTDL